MLIKTITSVNRDSFEEKVNNFIEDNKDKLKVIDVKYVMTSYNEATHFVKLVYSAVLILEEYKSDE